MRKFTIAAGAAIIASLVAVPIASAQIPEPELNVTVTPSKAGTKRNAKSSKLKLEIANSNPSLTASEIVVKMPSTVKLSTTGLGTCDADELESSLDPSVCPSSSRVGTGTAHARSAVNTSTPTPLTFDLTAYIIGRNQLGFFIDQQGGDIKALAKSRLRGRNLEITIPQLAQEFPPNSGTYNGLVDITTTVSKKRGRNALIKTTGCKSRKHSFGLEVTYIANPNPANAGTGETTDDARCS